MPKITVVEGLMPKNTDTKHGCRGGGGVDKIAEIVIWFSIFSFSGVQKVIQGVDSKVKNLTSHTLTHLESFY